MTATSGGAADPTPQQDDEGDHDDEEDQHHDVTGAERLEPGVHDHTILVGRQERPPAAILSA